MKAGLPLMVLALLPTITVADGDATATRVFEGSGRACYGKLVITPKAISWDTPFSRCASGPYELLEQKSQGKERRSAYLLKKRGKGCLYQVIVLEHGPTTPSDLDWAARGFQSLQDYKAANEQNVLTCGLVQLK